MLATARLSRPLLAADLVLPGVARASGIAGSRFVSTLWLHNPGGAAVDLELGLVTLDGPGTPVRVAVGPHGTRRVDDPVAALFGLETAAGTLTARADGPFLLRGVTANVADPRGTYGLALDAAPRRTRSTRARPGSPRGSLAPRPPARPSGRTSRPRSSRLRARRS